ncbi:MAG TPA: tetratricopeptide repeat protein [Candidatus Marinimicrobia bacterium]|nr:tetratricopeptide repeat protein [Candidatus Neomarinimicrobiota bacterium]
MIRKSIISLLILFSFGFSQDMNALQAQVDEAAKLLSASDILSASMLLESVLMSDSTFAPAHALYSELELQRGNLNEAQSRLIKAIKNNPNQETYRARSEKFRELVNKMRDANRERESGNSDASKKIYNEILSEFPNFAEVYYLLAIMYLQDDDYKAAKMNFTKAAELAPTEDKYSKGLDAMLAKYFQRGQESFKLGDYTTAEKYYRISLEIDSKYVNSYLQLGVLKQKQGDLDGAITCLQKGIEAKPEDVRIHYTLGLYYLQTKKNNEALNQFLQAIKLNPNYSRAWSSAGKIYLAQNNLSKAAEYYKKSIDLDQSSAAAYDGYGDVLIQQNRYKEAIDALSMAVALAPRSYTTFYRLAQAYNHEKMYSEAIDAAQSATKINPRFAAAFIEMGFAYAYQGKDVEAINTFGRARSDPRWRQYAEHQIELLRSGKPVEP